MSRGLVLVWLALLPACSDYALEPMPDIPPDAEPDIEVSPGELPFGPVLAGELGSRTLYVRNLGLATLFVDPITLEGSAAFTVLDGGEGFTVEASGEVALEVIFEPDEPSALEATLSVASNDPDTPVVTVPLSGQGLVPWLSITPATHDFGEVMVPCEQQLELVLQNVGNTTLEIDSLTYEGDGQLVLTEDPGPALALVPGEVAYATVLLRPTTPGETSGALVATGNDPRGTVEATQQATVTWAGEATDRFVVPEDPPVDVLIAVDQSGSMDDDAQALGEAFASFITTIGAQTLGWNLGVVTLDHACFNHGVLTADTPGVEALFGEAVTTGTDEDVVLDEQLLQLTDRALQQTVPGACNEGFLRPDAMLHIVVVSDEPERSAETASAWTWDYWVDRALPYVTGRSLLKISGVIDLDGCNEGAEGYLEAIEATGGEALSICDADWAAHAAALAEASADFLFSFPLSAQPDEASIVVTIEGSVVEDGWSWDASANAVVFGDDLADSVPGGSSLEVTYGIAASCE